MIRLSIYDMDKTITRRATFGPFLAYAVPRHRPWRLLLSPLLLASSLAYGARAINRAQLKQLNTALMLGRRLDPARIDRLARGFAARTLSRNLLQRALEQIGEDHREGRRAVLATASYGFYVREIAALLNVDDVVSTAVSQRGNHMSPRIAGENCYGEAKLAMIRRWMAEQGLKRENCHIRFYSDHVSDAPALEWADEAYATNPHAPLRRLARARGWTILDWRKEAASAAGQRQASRNA
jgi:HAD superfamily phosphoserine phosphatase-like hydrolase